MQYLLEVKFGVETELTKYNTREEATKEYHELRNRGFEVKLYIY